jgi:general secretion pathway protein M
MTAFEPIDRYLARHPSLSALVYVGVVVALFSTTLFLLADIVDHYRARNASLELLTRLQERAQASPLEGRATTGLRPAGSPFLEGQTMTLASAALLQRITGAITGAGGTVVSSEIEPRGAQSKDNTIRAVAICELDQASLQQLLYDIEAGMPFLFIDQLVVEVPPAPSEGGRMRVRLGVSGLWAAAK